MKEQNITVSITSLNKPHTTLSHSLVQVALRVRPINPKEVRSGAIPIARAVDKNVSFLIDIIASMAASTSHYHMHIVSTVCNFTFLTIIT